METTASSIAAEFKRQAVSKLPAEPIPAGGFHHITVKVSAPPGVSTSIYFDAVGMLLQQLVDERPEWKIRLEGGMGISRPMLRWPAAGTATIGTRLSSVAMAGSGASWPSRSSSVIATCASAKNAAGSTFQHRKLTTFCRKAWAEQTIRAISGR